jgi:hypothetical protein
MEVDAPWRDMLRGLLDVFEADGVGVPPGYRHLLEAGEPPTCSDYMHGASEGKTKR